MAVTCKAFGSFTASVFGYLFGATGINANATLKMALTAVAPNQDTAETFADITEIIDASYTPGGELLTNVTCSEAVKVVTINADDVVFTALNKNFRYAVVYESFGIVNPILVVIDCEAQDVESAGPQNVTIQLAAAGLLTHTVA